MTIAQHEREVRRGNHSTLDTKTPWRMQPRQPKPVLVFTAACSCNKANNLDSASDPGLGQTNYMLVDRPVSCLTTSARLPRRPLSRQEADRCFWRGRTSCHLLSSPNLTNSRKKRPEPHHTWMLVWGVAKPRVGLQHGWLAGFVSFLSVCIAICSAARTG